MNLNALNNLARYCMLREKKRKNLFGSVPRANRTSYSFVELLVELFWSHQVYRKKRCPKAMTIVDS